VTSTLANLYAFLFGAIFGSFLNVCILRLPREQSVVRPRSRCPNCGHQLDWFENLPIVSWIALRGRCRCCDERISVQYPLIELTVALGWLAAVQAYGFTFTALRLAVVGTILLGIALTDLREYLIPDGFTVTGLLWAIGTSIASYAMLETTIFAGPYGALIGACVGAGLIAIIGWIGEVITGREAMGMGDITLMAFVGAVVGPDKALLTVFLGAALGAVVFLGVVMPVMALRRSPVHGEQTELALGGMPQAGRTVKELPLVPFGVFLAPAGMVALLWGDSMLHWLIAR
jgi:leader peptidase (prepilin peptidase) / N-methyltransferase